MKRIGLVGYAGCAIADWAEISTAKSNTPAAAAENLGITPPGTVFLR
jgi:hypothetical protein